MADVIAPQAPPKRILLATDLSARGDRALDRATQLANDWGAELVVVHALEDEDFASAAHRGLPSWRSPPDNIATLERQIRDDIRGQCPPLRIHVQEGAPIKVILETLERERCDLIVVGLGRQRAISWPPLGKTIDELFRSSPASVLVVKRRPQSAYEHLLVGTDFTDEARLGLETATRLFPQASVALMHAFEMPYRSLLLDSQLSRDFGEMERSTLKDFADEARLPDGVRERLLPLIEHGPPEVMLSAYVMEHGADLTVVGAYERGLIFHAMVGGKGPRIVEAVPSDVLVVRPKRPDEARS